LNDNNIMFKKPTNVKYNLPVPNLLIKYQDIKLYFSAITYYSYTSLYNIQG